MDEFTTGWVTDKIPNWEFWLGGFAGHPCNYLEIGCYEGRSLLWMLENVLTHPDSTAVAIDPHRNEKVRSGRN